MSPLDPEVERLYREYLRSLDAEKAKRRREAAGVIGYIALLAIAVTVTLSIVWAYSSPKGRATHLPATTATAQAPQPTVTIGQGSATHLPATTATAQAPQPTVTIGQGSATHLPATTATAQAPQPTVTIGQPQVTVTEPSPAQNNGPDWIGISTILAGIGTLLAGVAAMLKLRRSREKPPKRKDSPELRVYDALADGQKTIAQLHVLLGLQPANLREALRSLVAHGLVRQHGGQGQAIWYQRTDSSKLAFGLRTRLWHDRVWVVFQDAGGTGQCGETFRCHGRQTDVWCLANQPRQHAIRLGVCWIRAEVALLGDDSAGQGMFARGL
jgi:hypothetical protein